MNYYRVVIQKPDMDTCLTGLILGVTGEDRLEVMRGEALEVQLDDPDVLCIEAGAGGWTERNNFDHHIPGRYLPAACVQAYRASGMDDSALLRLVEYVSAIDEGKPMEKRSEYPHLSSVFSGMLITLKGPAERFYRGMEIFRTVLEKNIDPFATMPGLAEWEEYIVAKDENSLRLQEVLQHAEAFETDGGLRAAFLENSFIGGIGALYSEGYRVVILYNSAFGEPPVRKYTIASDSEPVENLLPRLNELEVGWGGRQLIIGSPRTGSILPPEVVIKTVLRNL